MRIQPSALLAAPNCLSRLIKSAKFLCGFVDDAVAPWTLIVTDDWSDCADLRKRGYDHHAILDDLIPVSGRYPPCRSTVGQVGQKIFDPLGSSRRNWQ